MPALLRITGRIHLDQFWPVGTSDADTSKIKVDVTPGGFAWAADGETFRTTHAFDNARVQGKSRDPIIKNGCITVRLQGIDAPELHYKAGGLPSSRPDVTAAKRKAFNAWNKTERRQYWAEGATVALAQKLAGFGQDSIDCTVYAFVDAPYEAADTYGRIVGNVVVGDGVDINVWLTEQGWVFPTFYSSMSADEIQTLRAAAAKGRKKKRVWAWLTEDTGVFDADLVYRRNGEPDPAADKGPVLLPKLFRRLVAFHAEKAAGLKPGRFPTFLSKSPDFFFVTEEFLEAGVHAAEPYVLHDQFEGANFILGPEDLVFKEKFASVVDIDTGKRIEHF